MPMHKTTTTTSTKRGAIALIEYLRIVLFFHWNFHSPWEFVGLIRVLVVDGGVITYIYIYEQTKYFPGHSSATLRGVLVGRASV